MHESNQPGQWHRYLGYRLLFLFTQMFYFHKYKEDKIFREDKVGNVGESRHADVNI